MAFCLLASMNVAAQQTSLSVENQTPGWLSSKIAYGDQLTVENLKVTGYLNIEDLQFITRLMKDNSLHGRLDLEEANIVSSTGGTNNYLIYDEKVWGSNQPSASLKLNYLSLPQTIVNGDKKAMGKLDIDTLFINTKTGFAKTLYATVKHIVIGENISILKYPALSDLQAPTINGVKRITETIELPSTLKEIREIWYKYNSLDIISCRIVNGKNFKLFPSLERLYASFYIDEMPDSIYLPNIKILAFTHTVANEDDLGLNHMFRKGMHVFIGEKIDTLYEMGRAKNIHIHFSSSTPPHIENDKGIYGYTKPYNSSDYILYVPKGSANAYRACFTNDGTKVTIIEETIDVSDVSIDENKVSLNVGETISLAVNIVPEKATDKSVTWHSDNIEVAEVNSAGEVTAKKAGKALITVSSVSNPEIKDYCEITVVQPVTNVQLDKTEMTLVQFKDTKQLIATIKPDNASDKTILWSSSDSTVAIVDANGVVVAQKAGKATITATAVSNEDAKATCVVTVIQPVTGISLSESSLTITQLGEMKQLVANVIPEDATNKAVKWSSSNSAICSVSENGTVVATGYGTATIVATTVDGGFPAACVVSVVQMQPITVTAKSYTRAYGEENPTFEYVVEGGTIDGISDITCEATTSSSVGTYPIVITKGSVTNPNITYLNGTMTIEKAYQTLTWEQDFSNIKQYDQVELTATASSGLDVIYTVEGTPICSIFNIGKKQYLDCIGIGETVIAAIQEGNNNYWQTTKICKPIYINVVTNIRHSSVYEEEITTIYNVTGNRMGKLQRGVNIIKKEDGTTQKVLVK